MELSCSSTPLMASRLPTKPSFSLRLASSNSLFLTNSSTALSKTRFNLVSARRRRGNDRSPASRGLGCRCLFGLGVPELAVIAGVAALVFGPKKLPEIGRSIGKTVKSFQQAAKEFESELKKEPEDGGTLPPLGDSPKAVDSEDEKKKLEASSTTENA